MDKNFAIKAHNISKQYRLGEIGTGTLSHDLNRLWAKIRGKEDPYLKIGESNDRTKLGATNYVWSLKDIDFEVEQGDAVGIIGRNGAGKSTLLKLLSRVTKPTTGYFEVNGRIASLLEVGTGFNPEMTGRENIFLNGAILGMRKKEIQRKFDEIVDFAGVERYIDTPVKRYSSGMYVRLAFAVAAHLESEILIVDEVLAVGDAEFQKKCLGKMGDVSKGEGRTVLFVSHNMGAIQNLCNKGIVMNSGKIIYNGNVENSVQQYLKSNLEENSIQNFENRKGSGRVKLLQIKIFGEEPNKKPQIGKPFSIEFTIDNPENLEFTQIRYDVRIDDEMGNKILWMSTILQREPPKLIGNKVIFKMDKLLLNEGVYYIDSWISIKAHLSDWIENVASFEVLANDFYETGKAVPARLSKVITEFKINYE